MEKRVAEFSLLRDPVAPLDESRKLLRVSSPLQQQVDNLVATDVTMQDLLETVGAMAAARMNAVTLAVARSRASEPAFDLAQGRDVSESNISILMRLIQLSDWLADQSDEAGEMAIRTRLKELGLLPDGEINPKALEMLLRDVGDVLVALAGLQLQRFDVLADVTRLYSVLALVMDLLDTAGHSQVKTVRALLMRAVLLPSRLELLFPQASIPMVRTAGVSDLYLLRSEWRGYVRGEIAALKSVMAKERLKQEVSETRETERIESTDSMQSSEQETSQETRNSSELSKEVATSLTASLQAGVNADVTGVFPGGTYRVGANAQGSIGVSHAERLATRTAQEAVSKAVSRVESSVRTQRSTRELVRNITGQEYELDNEGSTHVRGVYRWVDRVERFQIYKIPDRLQLEFQLPQPAEFFKARQSAAAALAEKGAPPQWKVTLDMTATDSTLHKIIDQRSADKLASMYHATELPPMPKDLLSMTEVITVKADGTPADDQGTDLLAPLASARQELVIPEGYEAYTVEYFMSATPAKGKWVREKSNNAASAPGHDITEMHVFHSIVAEAFIGGRVEYVTDWRPENQNLEDLFTTQGSAWNRSPNFGNAFARSSGVRSIGLAPGTQSPTDAPVRTRLVVGFRAVGASHLQATVRVHCRRTAESYAIWRQQVHDVLYNAWARWNRDYESSRQTSTMFGLAPTGERSPLKNRKVIVEELKRQIIAWLLEESPFAGRGSLKPRTGNEAWRDIDVNQTVANAPIIQFFEQAFDWPSMAWLFYAYYWADKSNWTELASLEANDPEMEAFLRAGSARVLVPVRKSFEDAVKYWLVYRQPFLGRGLPLPGHPLFVALADEIRNLTESSVEGLPVGRAWDVKTATQFVWLDESTALPQNEHPRIGETATTAPMIPVIVD